ncbi:hypothetical protein M0804_000586 [Polistes exclamans]|nr:hypothetical protein M0804_000586 [Polistes exclamans]
MDLKALEERKLPLIRRNRGQERKNGAVRFLPYQLVLMVRGWAPAMGCLEIGCGSPECCGNDEAKILDFVRSMLPPVYFLIDVGRIPLALALQMRTFLAKRNKL